MANPRSPHVIGVTLITAGVAKTKIIITNFTNGNRLAVATDASKRAVFDCASFTGAYSNGDVLGIENVGASYGGTTVTIDTTKGIQMVNLTGTAAQSVTLDM